MVGMRILYGTVVVCAEYGDPFRQAGYRAEHRFIKGAAALGSRIRKCRMRFAVDEGDGLVIPDHESLIGIRQPAQLDWTCQSLGGGPGAPTVGRGNETFHQLACSGRAIRLGIEVVADGDVSGGSGGTWLDFDSRDEVIDCAADWINRYALRESPSFAILRGTQHDVVGAAVGAITAIVEGNKDSAGSVGRRSGQVQVAKPPGDAMGSWDGNGDRRTPRVAAVARPPSDFGSEKGVAAGDDDNTVRTDLGVSTQPKGRSGWLFRGTPGRTAVRGGAHPDPIAIAVVVPSGIAVSEKRAA